MKFLKEEGILQSKQLKQWKISLTNLLFPQVPFQVYTLYFFSADTSFGGCS